MKKQTLQLMMVMAAFVWAGMVAGISFLEAPVKFTAPHVTLEIGLGIGRLVFGYLNKVELVLCAAVFLGALYSQSTGKVWLWVLSLTSLLLLQSFWLLPALDVRALAILAGQDPGESVLHLVYVALEIVKLVLLLSTGCMVFVAALKQEQQLRYKKFSV
ncbi:hypothetical protein [Pontibacter actiniarum]|nr:hypothetical protein [Pontibacter actiniarum]